MGRLTAKHQCGLKIYRKITVEVFKPASGVAYLRPAVNWKDCPFFCPEESVRGYQQCIYERVIPNYKGCEGGKQLFCKHAEVPTLMTSVKIRTKPIQTLLFMRKKKRNVSTFNGQMNFVSHLKIFFFRFFIFLHYLHIVYIVFLISINTFGEIKITGN